jgi:thiamine-phosphate pyrophosphorylase
MASRASALYAIVDWPTKSGVGVAEATRGLIAGGCRRIQLRAKHASTQTRVELLEQMRAIADRMAPELVLVINDDLAAARWASTRPGAWMLHLGQEDMAACIKRGEALPEKVGLGLSTHDLAQLQAAEGWAPDYVAYGPIFPTQSKARPDPVVGLEGLAAAASKTHRPIVAIGGIGLETALACLDAGASMVALISALAGDNEETIRRRTEEFLQVLASR